jgi:hypothetical protein
MKDVTGDGFSRLSFNFKSVKLWTFIFIAAILFIAAFVVFQSKNHSKKQKSSVANCSSVVQKSKQLLNSENYKNARDLLANSKDCSDVTDLTVRIQFQSNLALAYYQSNDKHSAKIYANDALTSAQKLRPNQRSKVVNYENVVISMQSITHGNYYGNGALN